MGALFLRKSSETATLVRLHGRVSSIQFIKKDLLDFLVMDGRLLWQPVAARGQHKRAASLLDHESSPALDFRYVISKKKERAISGSGIAQ